MDNLTVLGMPLNWEEPPNYTVSPISAIVAMKGIDDDGDEVYAVMVTDGMNSVEAGGLAAYANLYCTEMMKGQIYGAASDKSQDKQVTGEESSS